MFLQYLKTIYFIISARLTISPSLNLTYYTFDEKPVSKMMDIRLAEL